MIADAQYEHDYRTIYAGRDLNPGIDNYYDTAWHPYYDGTNLQHDAVGQQVHHVHHRRGGTDAWVFSDLDAKVLSLLPRRTIANLDARKQQMTIRQLLTMTAGFEWDESKTAYTRSAQQLRRHGKEGGLDPG